MTNEHKPKKQVLLVLTMSLLLLSVNVVSAWIGPTATAPGNNVENILDESNIHQAKDGNILPSSKLNIGDLQSTFNQTFSTNGLALWNRMVVVDGDVYMPNLNPDNQLHTVCTNIFGTLVLCP